VRNPYITKLVRCIETTDFWGHKDDEAHITAESIKEILLIIPGTWIITRERVDQRTTPGINFLERHDSQAWRSGNNGTT
jgi:hypothetical protein